MINLLPDEIKQCRKKEKYKKIFLVVMIVLFVILLGTSSYIERIAVSYQEELKQLEEQLQKLETTKKVISTQLKEKNKINEQLTLVNNLQNDLNYNWLIKDLQLIIPQQVWVEKLMIDQSNQLLVMIGNSPDNHQLLETAKRLEKYPYFEGIKIVSSKQLNENLNFTIKGRVSQEL